MLQTKCLGQSWPIVLVLKNEQKIRNDRNFKALENAFWAAEGGKFQFGG